MNQKNAEARQVAKRAKKKAKAKRIKEQRLRMTRLAAMSQSGMNLNKSARDMLGLSPRMGMELMENKPEPKTYTGKHGKAYEMEKIIDDLEDLEPKDIVRHLKAAKVIKIKDKKWKERPIDESVEAENSLYIWNRRSYFRRLCYNV